MDRQATRPTSFPKDESALNGVPLSGFVQVSSRDVPGSPERWYSPFYRVRNFGFDHRLQGGPQDKGTARTSVINGFISSFAD